MSDEGAGSGAEPSAAQTQRRHPLPGRLVWVVAVGVAGLITVLDQATKVLAVEHLPGSPIDLGVVTLRLVLNPNAAFGIPGFPGMFLLVTVIVTLLIGRLLASTDRLWLAFAYGLVVGGALGNGLDRALREPGFPEGAVVDFLDLGWFPVFNVADSAISVGAVLLVVLLFLREREEAEASAGGGDEESVRPETAPPRQ